MDRGLKGFLIRQRDRAIAYVFGRDVFISYSRAGALAYARALANALKNLERPISVYFDQWAAPPGAELPPTLLLALRRARVLVVVATEHALQSQHVGEEIAHFAKRPRSIVTINDGCLTRAREENRCWPAVLNGAWQLETTDAIAAGTPSPAVIRNIVEVVGDATQERRLRTVARRTAIAFCLAVIVAAGFTLGAWWLERTAQRKQIEAEGAELKARRATFVQQMKLSAATTAAADAKTQQENAERQTRVAQDATETANRATKTAEDQKKRAQQLGYALSLANEASSIFHDQNPNALPRVALAAARAIMETTRIGIHSLQTDQAARHVLDLMPEIHDPLKGRDVKGIWDVSADGNRVVMTDGDHVAVVDLATNQAATPKESSSSMRGWRLSGDGSRVAAWDSAGALHVWNSATGDPVGTPIPSGSALDSTGEHVAVVHFSGPEDARLTIHGVATGEAEGAELKTAGVNGVLFSPITPLVVFTNRSHLFMWRWKTDKEPTPLGDDEVRSPKDYLFTHNGNLVVAAWHNDRACLTLWSLVGEPEQKWRRELDRINGMVLAQDDSELAVWDDDAVTLRLLSNGAKHKTIPSTATTFAGVSSWFLVTLDTNNVIKVFDLDNLMELNRVVYDAYSPLAIKLAGNKITVVSRNKVQVWGDVEGPVTRLSAIPAHLAFLPDEDVVLFAQGTLIGAYRADGYETPSWVKVTSPPTALAAATMRRVLVGHPSGEVTIHGPSRELPPLRQPGTVTAIAVSRSSRYVAVVAKGIVYVWSDWATAAPHRTTLANAGLTTAIAFGASDDQLVTGSSDGVVQRWNWRSGSPAGPAMKQHGGVRSLSVNRSGTTIASTGSTHEVALWDARTGAKRTLVHPGDVPSAAFDPTGDYLATTSSDFYFRIWYIGQGEPEVVTRVQFDEFLNETAFSPSGRRVAYGGYLTLSAWKPEDLLEAICRRVDCSAPAPEIR